MGGQTLKRVGFWLNRVPRFDTLFPAFHSKNRFALLGMRWGSEQTGGLPTDQRRTFAGCGCGWAFRGSASLGFGMSVG